MAITLKGSGQAIVQIVQTTTTTTFSNSSNTTPTDVISLSITPTSASNKIYVIQQMTVRVTDANSVGNHEAVGRSILYRDSTIIDICQYLTYVSSESRQQWLDVRGGHNFIDSPATTNAVTYKASIFSTNTAYVMYTLAPTFSTGTGITTLTLMEISG